VLAYWVSLHRRHCHTPGVLGLPHESVVAADLFVAQVAAFGLTEVWIRVRTRRSTPSAHDRLSRPVVGLGLVLGVASAILVAAHWPGGSLPAPWTWFVAGLMVTAAGIALRIWAVLTLGDFFTTEVRVSPDQSVVAGGPYRWVRHPSYTALLLEVAGLGLAQTNWLSVVCAVALPLPGLVWRIRIEEAALRAELGAAYDDYAADRSRLLPGIW
jgi:protein-S-isoprenylcysteine O-methyltransferase Ste14